MTVGGIVGYQGYIAKAYISNCYNRGNVTAITGNVGGISNVSNSTTGSEIKNCYNTGIVSVTGQTNNNIRRSYRNKKYR